MLARRRREATGETRLGLAFGSAQVAAAVVRREGKGPAFLCGRAFPWEPADPANLRKGVETLCREAGTRRPLVRAVLAEDAVSTRYVSVPPLPPKATARYLSRAGATADAEPPCWTASVLDVAGGEILLATSSRADTRSLLRTLRKAGFRVEGLFPPFAPALVLAARTPAKDPGILVDLSTPRGLRLTVLEGARARVYRSLPLDGAPEKWGEFVGTEVTRTAAYYKSQSRGRRAERLAYAGPDGPCFQALRTLESVGLFPAGIERLGPWPTQDSEPLVALATLAAAAAGDRSFDLLPAEWRRPGLRRAAATTAAAILLLGGIATARTLREIASGERAGEEALRSVTASLSLFTEVETLFDSMQEDRARGEDFVRTAETVRSARPDLVGALGAFLAARPDDVFLTALAFQSAPGEAPAILAQGIAEGPRAPGGRAPLDAFVRALRDAEVFETATAEFGGSSLAEGERGAAEVFTVRATLRRRPS